MPPSTVDNPFETKQVGEFPEQRNQRLAYRNPLDVATIVSIFPESFISEKYTLFPGKFYINGGTLKTPGLTLIGVSSWWRQVQGGQPDQEVPTSSVAIAESIINDYCNGLVECNMGDKMPGMFYIPGNLDITEIQKKYKTALDTANIKQKNWFAALVSKADADWVKYNNNPRAILSTAKFAAGELGFLDKPWLKDMQALEKVKCFACGNLRDPEYPVCGVCKAIDPNHPLASSLQFAK